MRHPHGLATVAADNRVGANSKEKMGMTYKTFLCWTFASRSTGGGSATCVCIVLHVDLEVCSIINRLDGRFQPDAYIMCDEAISRC
jgi:hypothetical protein